jgi:hypothetical protein
MQHQILRQFSLFEMKTPTDVVANIITIKNGSLQDNGQSMFHNKSLDKMA